MDSLVAKCFVCNVECCAQNKYLECVKKIEDYDHLVQLTSQIETELYGLYRKKLEEPCYLLDAEIIDDHNAINAEILIQSDELKMEKSSDNSDDVTDGTYDDGMVVEYLDDYEVQSDEGDLNEEQKEPTINEAHENNSSAEFEKGEKSNESVAQKVTQRKAKQKRGSLRSRNAKMKEDKQLLDNLFEGDLKCYMCKYVAENRSDLEVHKTLKHDEIQKLVCDICGRSYKSKSALCVHLGIHSGRNSHECHICGKTFTQRGALVRHMPMHTGEQPHQCDVCGKRFTHYSSFHMHQMIHTNERKKKCNICGSEFRSNSHMTRHMRSHTGEKPFSCPICGQKFAQRYNMKTHYNTHNGIHRPQSRNHKCVICDEAFPRREKLNRHLRQAHRISDADIKNIAEHGPESEITKQIIDRLKANVYTKEEIFIEFESIDGSEMISAEPQT
ncbi:zinc finger protein 90 homolog isoform X2 [Contarinia nasturtii]|uniref:zinc finger protein 90 homolog isoform X2 n=1 Tax=Contarinia nasturtii TaxID=265458 RepID=UPI0012D49932|nr:zinc finger protein 90 homolog isoform X2 [Contarinia nasturtii]